MARIRSVKPGLFGSYTISDVPVEARYLFIGLFCEADDEGRMIDSAKRIAGAVFPHDEKVTEKKVDGWLTDLQRIKCIFRYTVGKGKYILLPKWSEHQKISHPLDSMLPKPDDHLLEVFLKCSGMPPEDGESVSALNGKWKGSGNGI